MHDGTVLEGIKMRIWLVPSRPTPSQIARARYVAGDQGVADEMLAKLNRGRWAGVLRLAPVICWVLGIPIFLSGLVVQLSLHDWNVNGITGAGLVSIYIGILTAYLHRGALEPWVLRSLHRVAMARSGNLSHKIHLRESIARHIIRVAAATRSTIPLGRWTSFFSFHDRVVKRERRLAHQAWMAHAEGVIVQRDPDLLALEDALWRLLLRVYGADFFTIKELGPASEPGVKVTWLRSLNWSAIITWVAGIGALVVGLIQAFHE